MAITLYTTPHNPPNVTYTIDVMSTDHNNVVGLLVADGTIVATLPASDELGAIAACKGVADAFAKGTYSQPSTPSSLPVPVEEGGTASETVLDAQTVLEIVSAVLGGTFAGVVTHTADIDASGQRIDAEDVRVTGSAAGTFVGLRIINNGGDQSTIRLQTTGGAWHMTAFGNSWILSKTGSDHGEFQVNEAPIAGDFRQALRVGGIIIGNTGSGAEITTSDTNGEILINPDGTGVLRVTTAAVLGVLNADASVRIGVAGGGFIDLLGKVVP